MVTRQDRLIELAFELSPAGILAVDRQGNILLVNREVESLFGYGEGELNGQSIELLVPEHSRSRHPQFREHFFSNPSSRPMGKGVRLSGLRKDGTEIPVEVGLNPVESDGELITLATVVDITAREMAEERFRTAVESAPSGMLMTDAQGRILLANREIEKLFKYSKEQLQGMIIEDLIPERYRSQHPVLRQGFFSDPKTRAMGMGRELFGLRSDGSEIPLEIGLNPIQGPEGLSVLVSIVDISARKSAERQIRQAQKMEAVGTLAGGIAHDFNNILLNILGHAELVQLSLNRSSTEYEDLGQIITAAQRGKSLVDRILTFSRHDPVEAGTVDCIKVVREAMKLLRATTPATISLHEIYEDDVPRIEANDTQLHQIILNLATNAVHAMPDGGVLEVRIAPWIQKEKPSVNGWNENNEILPGLYSHITVSDNGAGMEQEQLDRIFEPFYTTKGPGEGSGLGLAIVHGIVESSGGRITVSSEPGRGTSFDIFLPALAESESDYNQQSEDRDQDRIHVLAVDDEKPLARILGRQLDQFGFAVTSFHSSLEALSAFKQDPDKFDVLITDNTMPKMSGVELVQQIKLINPDLPVVFLSGHLTEDKLGQLKEMPSVASLRKPYTRQELYAVLQDLLED